MRGVDLTDKLPRGFAFWCGVYRVGYADAECLAVLVVRGAERRVK